MAFRLEKRRWICGMWSRLWMVEQTAALAAMLRYTMEHINGSNRISEIVEMLEKEISNGGLEAVVGGDCVRCGLAMPRKQEIFACFNRYRG